MRTWRSTTRGLLVALLLGAGSAYAQPAPEPVRPVIIRPITPTIVVPVTRDSPTWDDDGRHVRIVADYDGRSVRVLSAASGEGSARSYLSQRRDIVVVILDGAGSVLRELNLPDPRELRVVGQPPGSARDPRSGRTRPAAAEPREETIHLDSAQFELFVPRLADAQSLEFRAGSTRGRLLGEVDLAQVP